MCQDGFYNASCTAECGHCLHGEVCDKQDGTCMNGCSSNFLPPLCQGISIFCCEFVVDGYYFKKSIVDIDYFIDLCLYLILLSVKDTKWKHIIYRSTIYISNYFHQSTSISDFNLT